MNRFREQSVSAALFLFPSSHCTFAFAVVDPLRVQNCSFAESENCSCLRPHSPSFLSNIVFRFPVSRLSTHGITMFGIIIHLGYISQHIWYHSFPYYHSHHFLRYIWYFISQTSHFSALWYLYKQGKTVFGTMLRLLRFIYIFELLSS